MAKRRNFSAAFKAKVALEALAGDQTLAELLDPKHPRLGIVRQCALVSIARSSFYYRGKGESAGEPEPHAPERRAIPGDAVVRLAPDGPAPAASGLFAWGASGCAA